jgi:O-methyltransferase involved in polyketide biosynthesis
LAVEIGLNGLTDQNLGRHLEVAEIFGSDLIRVVVGETGVEESLQAFVVREGVTFYLPPEAVEARLRFVGGSVLGTSIIFDYVIEGAIRGDHTETLDGSSLSGEPF